MCLAVKGKLVELKEGGKKAVVKFKAGEERELINIISAKEGDTVLVQQGLVVEVIGGGNGR